MKCRAHTILASARSNMQQQSAHAVRKTIINNYVYRIKALASTQMERERQREVKFSLDTCKVIGVNYSYSNSDKF